MNAENLTAISKALSHLVTNKAPLQVILRNINQFGIALVPAETCTTWIRDRDAILVCKDTAYPLCYTQPVAGMAIEMNAGKGVGLTAHMAYQFAHDSEKYQIFNLSYPSIMGHRAYGGGKPVNPYFPTSNTSLSLLCAPLRAKATGEFMGMIKIENKLNPWGFPSGEFFTQDEVVLVKTYAELLAPNGFSQGSEISVTLQVHEKVRKKCTCDKGLCCKAFTDQQTSVFLGQRAIA